MLQSEGPILSLTEYTDDCSVQLEESEILTLDDQAGRGSTTSSQPEGRATLEPGSSGAPETGLSLPELTFLSDLQGVTLEEPLRMTTGHSKVTAAESHPEFARRLLAVKEDLRRALEAPTPPQVSEATVANTPQPAPTPIPFITLAKDQPADPSAIDRALSFTLPQDVDPAFSPLGHSVWSYTVAGQHDNSQLSFVERLALYALLPTLDKLKEKLFMVKAENEVLKTSNLGLSLECSKLILNKGLQSGQVSLENNQLTINPQTPQLPATPEAASLPTPLSPELPTIKPLVRSVDRPGKRKATSALGAPESLASGPAPKKSKHVQDLKKGQLPDHPHHYLRKLGYLMHNQVDKAELVLPMLGSYIKKLSVGLKPRDPVLLAKMGETLRYPKDFQKAIRTVLNDPLLGLVHYTTKLDRLQQLTCQFKRVIQVHFGYEELDHHKRHNKQRHQARLLVNCLFDFFHDCKVMERLQHMKGTTPDGLSHPTKFPNAPQ